MPTDSLEKQLQAALGAAYAVERELGGGGMSRVFVAHDEALGRDVVVKVLSPELAEGLSAERFTREIRLAAALQEPHIVPVHAAGTTANGLPWYTMPFVRGESLRARMAQGAVPPAEAVAVLRDVATALEYAHERGVVHRDVKPENVLLSGRTAVVTDFGIAKALSASKTHAPGVTLTRVGTSLGTPAYMAPEQAAGDEVDHRADLYAWGVMAYELLAGRHPFAGKATAQQLIAAHIAEVPEPLAAVAPGVPPALAALVMRCLAKIPAQRPAAAREVLGALDAVSTGEGLAPTRGISSTSRSRRFAALAGLLILLIAGAAAALAFRSRRAGLADAPSIAVLPFEHYGPPEQAFFADGLTDAVTGKLIGVSGLTVIDRRSAATYRGSAKPATQIGRELGVAYLLEGVVRWARGAGGEWRAQVTPTLVRTRDGKPQWAGEPVVVTPTDPFTAQAAIAGQVVEAIGVAVGEQEREALAAAPTRNAEAYEAYLRARTLYQRPSGRTPAALAEAAALLERATRLDPTFALAFADLALVEHWRAFYDASPPRRRDAALRAALALDPELPEAHYARAEILWFEEGRFAEAAAAFARASAARPGDAEMLSEYSAVLIVTGRTAEGFASLERGTELDPRNAVSNGRAAFFAWHFRRLDAAERHARRMLAIAPDDWTGHVSVLQVALARGDTAAARRGLEEATRATGRPWPFADVFWMLPLTLAKAPETPASGALVPNLAMGSDSLLHYVALGAWARETGQPARARGWFDTALAVDRAPANAAALRSIYGVPNSGQRAIALAGTGRVAEARASIGHADSLERAIALPNEPNIARAQDYLAYAELVLGDREAALTRLERLLVLPSGHTPAMLRTMWPYQSLHDDVRFRRLAEMP